MKIVADENIPFLRGALEPYADIRYIPGKQITNELLVDTDALLVRTRTKCSEKLLMGTGVRFIGTATIGFDHIDTVFCSNNNIRWTNAPGCNSSSVQQYITAALLKLADDNMFKLTDKTLGIVGVGNVGSKVAKAAAILGMKVLLNDPPRQRRERGSYFVPLETILCESDILTVHVPLSFEGEYKTYHLFDEKRLDLAKDKAWFINTSRGEVTDTIALRNCLSSGKLSGSVLDVWENEPDIDLELLTKSFIATPHIAGYSTDGKANGTAMVVNSLCNFFGLPLKGWYPDNIPSPVVPELTIDCRDKTHEKIFNEAVLHTYNIVSDDLMLRSFPVDFEKQRGDYPLRREFPSYTINLKGCSSSVRKQIEELGFKVREISV